MKRTILAFIAYYLPGYKSGGPVRTVSNMVEHLQDDFEFKIVTSDRDFGDSRPYPGISSNTWSTVGLAKVLYQSPENLSILRIKDILESTNHDVLYLNSAFNWNFTIKPLLVKRFFNRDNRPTVLAPRGEFSEGALTISAGKKKLYLRVAKMLKLYENVEWQASSSFEADDIIRVFNGSTNRIKIAKNLGPKAVPLYSRPDRRGPIDCERPLRIVFVSRIAPKKNLDYALETINRLKVRVEFNIFGPVESSAYWLRCQEIIAKSPANIIVAYHGPIPHEGVQEIFADHDLFFFPTLGENYGHVILEALSAGTPVLIADTTPWRGLADIGVGWDLPLTEMQRFQEKIEHFAGLSMAKFKEMSLRAREYASEKLTSEETINSNRNLFTVPEFKITGN